MYLRLGLALLVVLGALSPLSGRTQALFSARRGDSVTIRALRAADALEVSPDSLDLGVLEVGKQVNLKGVLQITNRWVRDLRIEVALTGVPGLDAQLRPNSPVRPGDTRDVDVKGRPQEVGEINGYLIITALNGFLRVEVPVTGVVEESSRGVV